jgi:hypothetical protein
MGLAQLRQRGDQRHPLCQARPRPRPIRPDPRSLVLLFQNPACPIAR